MTADKRESLSADSAPDTVTCRAASVRTSTVFGSAPVVMAADDTDAVLACQK